MRKFLILLITTMSAISFATEPDPMRHYSIEQLNKYSSVIVDGNIFHIEWSKIEETETERIRNIKYWLLPHAVLKNDTDTNIKRDTAIKFELLIRSDLENEPAPGLNLDDNIRLFLPRYIRDLDERIVVTTDNQIHPELYGTGKRSKLNAMVEAGEIEVGFSQLGVRFGKSLLSENSKDLLSQCFLTTDLAATLVPAETPEDQSKTLIEQVTSKIPSEGDLSAFMTKLKTTLKERDIPIEECVLSSADGKVVTRNGITFAEKIDLYFMSGEQGFCLHIDMAQYVECQWRITDGPVGSITVFGGKEPTEDIELM